MSKIVSAEAAAARIPDGATLTVSASSGLACPDAVLAAIGRRFGAEGRPRGLTSVNPLAAGDMYGIDGIGHLAQAGLLSRVLAGSLPSGPSTAPEPAIWRMIREEQVAAWNLPAGIVFDLHREAARTRLGVLTEVGLDTFADPRRQGCAMNGAAAAAGPIVSVVGFQGREMLYFHPIAPDVAIVRGTTADAAGNVSVEHEGASLGGLDQALAVRNLGGLVIAQVERLAGRGERGPHDIRIPGHLVDLVVVAPEQMQATQTRYDPAISGQERRAAGAVERLDWGVETAIARRVAQELRPGEVVNIGFGVSANVPRVLHQAGRGDAVTFVTEQGATGGLPLTGFQFGCALNPEAIMPWAGQWALLQGGGVARALLSFLEVDAAGCVNVTRLAARPHVTSGCGGFVDITTGVRNLVFSGRFDAGGSAVSAGDGRLRIEAAGRIVKLVPEVDHVSFSGRMGRARGQNVMLITERCVLRFGEAGWRLTEVAPGVDARADVLDRIPFAVGAEEVATMDPAIFTDAPFDPMPPA